MLVTVYSNYQDSRTIIIIFIITMREAHTTKYN